METVKSLKEVPPASTNPQVARGRIIETPKLPAVPVEAERVTSFTSWTPVSPAAKGNMIALLTVLNSCAANCGRHCRLIGCARLVRITRGYRSGGSADAGINFHHDHIADAS